MPPAHAAPDTGPRREHGYLRQPGAQGAGIDQPVDGFERGDEHVVHQVENFRVGTHDAYQHASDVRRVAIEQLGTRVRMTRPERQDQGLVGFGSRQLRLASAQRQKLGHCLSVLLRHHHVPTLVKCPAAAQSAHRGPTFRATIDNPAPLAV